ncbi:MAG TPA: ABC transporter substrate-binding protein [Stellaceae bacterium]|nr:ABC transporter substrate-binding protein [Stellaceae bacterium]
MTTKETVPFGVTLAPSADQRAARRRALRAIAAAGAAVLMLGALDPSARADDAIKIGILLPLSGNFAENGQQTLTGLKMYFDEVGNAAAGHKLDLIVEDTQGKPDVAVTKARKLVERDEAQVLTGVVSSGEALAVNEYSRDNKVPLVFSGDAGADELTMPGPLLNPYVVRVTQNGRTVSAAAADWAYKKGWRKVTLIASDYAGGVDVMHGFAQSFCRLGGKVTQENWPPIATADFGPYLTNLDRTADAVVTFNPGADGLRLGRQYSEFGLKGKLPVLDIYGTVVYESNLAQLGDAVLGMYSSLFYTPMLKTPENERFVTEYRKRMGSMPSNEGPNGYVGAHALVDAIKAVNGDLNDKMKFIAALKAVKFPSPKGDISLDKYGMVIQTMYIREAEKVDGQIGNVPIATYPNVDQFWPFSEAEFESYKYTYKDLKGSLTDCGKVLAKK